MLGKDKLNTVEVLINNALREYYEFKKAIKIPESSVKYTI